MNFFELSKCYIVTKTFIALVTYYYLVSSFFIYEAWQKLAYLYILNPKSWKQH